MLHDDCSLKPRKSDIGSRIPTLPEEARRARIADAEGGTAMGLFVEGHGDTRAHVGRRDWDSGRNEGQRGMQPTAHNDRSQYELIPVLNFALWEMKSSR